MLIPTKIFHFCRIHSHVPHLDKFRTTITTYSTGQVFRDWFKSKETRCVLTSKPQNKEHRRVGRDIKKYFVCLNFSLHYYVKVVVRAAVFLLIAKKL